LVCTAWENTAVLVQSYKKKKKEEKKKKEKKKKKKKKKTTSFGQPTSLIARGRASATLPSVIHLCKDMLHRCAQIAGLTALCMHAPRCKLRWEPSASQT